MSSRQLRKLQKQREEEERRKSELESTDEAEEDGTSAVKLRPNLFAALGGDDEDNSADEEESQDRDGQDGTDIKDEAPTSTGSKRSKKKKKKKRQQMQQRQTPDNRKDEMTPSGQGEEDEIDKAMKELGVSLVKGDESLSNEPKSSVDSKTSKLFKINTYNLKAIHEMRNLFGRDVIETAQAEEDQGRHGRGRRVQEQVDLETFLREPPGAKKLPEVSLRRNIFIQGREHWPRATAGGLTMQEVGKASDGSYREYAYQYDKVYDGSQVIFFALVQMGDPMQMVRYLKQTPYHVSTLLQVSNVAKQDQNMALAAELCERALFTFGRTTTTSFRQDVENGRARLDFRRPENRQLWLAGYHYIKSLMRKGTYRTALEWAKLLFSLDPKDPYAMRHFIHVLAMKAYEASWLLGFLDELDTMSGVGDAIYLQQTCVPALLQLGDTEQARTRLVDGMRRIPWLYCMLFQELNMDAPPSIWGIKVASRGRMFWSELYLCYAKELWDNPRATWLLREVATSLERDKMAQLPPDDDPAIDRGSVRLAFLEGQVGLMGLSPQEMLESEPNYEFDPLPPPKEENIFHSIGAQIQWPELENAEGRVGIIAALQQELGRHVGLEEMRALAAAHALGDDELEQEREQEQGGGDEDDEELQRDLAAAIAASTEEAGGDDPGMVAGLLRMLGLGTGWQGDEGDDEVLPGTWPE